MTANALLTTIRRWLGAVRLGAGDRLPSERALAARFGVTRAELRKAMAILAEEGHVERQVGRGTFLARGAASARPAAQDIADQTSPIAAMQARSVVEPELARLAALGATAAQFADMRALCTAMRAAPSWDAYAELDWRFHNLIAEATGNVLLVEIQHLLNGVRRHVVWGDLATRADRPPADYHSFAEHAAILAAMEARDPDGAMRAMAAHLDRTRSLLLDRRPHRPLTPAHAAA